MTNGHWTALSHNDSKTEEYQVVGKQKRRVIFLFDENKFSSEGHFYQKDIKLKELNNEKDKNERTREK